MSTTLRAASASTMQPTWLPSFTLKAWLLGVMQVLCVVCLFIQVKVDASTENLVSTALVCGSTTLLVQYLWRSQAMQTHPISSFALLGFDASCQFVSLVTQSLEFAPFVNQLRAPLLTFTILSMSLVVAIVAHVCHRHFLPFRTASEGLAKHVFGPLQVHRIPQPYTLWIFASVGLFAMATGGGNFGDAGGKFMAAFTFMMWAPFLMPLFQKIVGNGYCDMRKQGALLMLYFGVIIVIGLVKNYRAVIFVAPLQVVFTYIIVSCWQPAPLSGAFMRRVGVAMLAGFILAPVLGDVVTAMEIARANRDKATPMEMLQQTGEAFMDKKRLVQYREAAGLSRVLGLYDEQYLSNPMMARFTETKFHDNMLYFGQSFSERDREALIDNEINKAIAIVPQNFLDILDIKLRKEELIYSNGDYYLNLTMGGHLGGFATGSMWADLYVIFGNWWPVATFGLLIVVFMTMDAFVDLRPGRFICVSTMCHMWQLFLYGISSESIVNKFNQVTRGMLQEVLVYGVLIAICVFALKLLKLQAFVPLDEDTAPTGKLSH
jgi:hypothetical protein